MEVFLITSSKHKMLEIKKYFDDINKPIQWVKNQNAISPSENEYITLREQTKLLDENNKNCSLEKACKCYHLSTFHVEFYKKNDEGEFFKEKEFSFRSTVEGFIFPHMKNKTNDPSVYGWDDIFVPKNNKMTNSQLKEKGIKLSARDISFSKLTNCIKNLLFMSSKANLNFNAVEIDEVIILEPFLYNLFCDNKYYQKAYNDSFFRPIIDHVLNNGVFLRRASTRSQRNYWAPGINAGIPLTAKKDEIHELTFMFHDLMHFMFPDFMITGETELDKKVYIMSRMMSEAFTIFLADAMFISVLEKGNVDYDYSKRKIYPFFKEIIEKKDLSNIDEVLNVLYANSRFALLGDDKPLIEMGSPEKFEDYKGKYQKFFKEDYLWTKENSANLQKDAKVNKQWYNDISHFNELTTTDMFIKNTGLLPEANKEQIFSKVFEFFAEKMRVALENKNKFDENASLIKAFSNYLSGQMMIFHKIENQKNSLFKNELSFLCEKLQRSVEIIETKKQIETIKEFYSLYINMLIDDQIISAYIGESYKNIYPIFSPHYVFYERNNDQNFNDVVNGIFGGNNEQCL